eukprot:939692-Rhodomonas_salina.3
MAKDQIQRSPTDALPADKGSGELWDVNKCSRLGFETLIPVDIVVIVDSACADLCFVVDPGDDRNHAWEHDPRRHSQAR